MVAEGQSVNEFEEDADCPKCDMDADEMAVNEIVKDAVFPKSDMDAEAFDEDAENSQESEKGAAAKKYTRS